VVFRSNFKSVLVCRSEGNRQAIPAQRKTKSNFEYSPDL